MTGKKSAFFKKNYSVIILVLILISLFCFQRAIGRSSYVEANNKKDTENNSFQTAESLQIKNRFLMKALNHTFPAINTDDSDSNWSLKENLNFSVIGNILNVDLKNPLTFIQFQFPASTLHPPDESLFVLNSNRGSQRKSTLNEERENINAVTAIKEPYEEVPMDEDDLGELRRDVFVIGGEDIVDSLSSPPLNLQDIDKPQKIKLEKNKPQILIYHTHGTEAYKPASEGNYHTLRKEYSVLKIGEIMAAGLEKKGFNVIHDTTYHNYPSFSGSYIRSLNTAKNILEENKSIEVIFDVHRDGFDNIDTNPNRENIINNNRVVINNQTYARFMFVIGPAAQNRNEVEKFARYINAISDSKYPGLSRPVMIKPYGRFNQFLSDHYALIEVGSNANTIEEAKRTAGLLVEIIAKALEGIRQ